MCQVVWRHRYTEEKETFYNWLKCKYQLINFSGEKKKKGTILLILWYCNERLLILKLKLIFPYVNSSFPSSPVTAGGRALGGQSNSSPTSCHGAWVDQKAKRMKRLFSFKIAPRPLEMNEQLLKQTFSLPLLPPLPAPYPAHIPHGWWGRKFTRTKLLP